MLRISIRKASGDGAFDTNYLTFQQGALMLKLRKLKVTVHVCSHIDVQKLKGKCGKLPKKGMKL